MASAKILPLTAALAALSLAACSNTEAGGMAGNRNVCMPFPAATANAPASASPANGQAPATAPPLAGDPAATLEDCLHRWGYALAASRDDANQVATATVAACGAAISRWNQGTLASDEGDGGPMQAPSLLTGQMTTPIAEHYLFAQGRALFYVVQARAGRCAAPPLSNGVLTGVAY